MSGENRSFAVLEGLASAQRGATFFDGAEAAHTPRVLLVDDEAVVRSLFENLLAAPDYAFVSYESAEDALAGFCPGAFDVAVLDQNLPGMNGIDLLGELKRRDADVEVIIITGFASVQTAIGALQRGAYDYVEKPFADLDLVVGKVRKAVERRSLSLMNRRLLDHLRHANQRLTERNVELLEAQEELLRQLRFSAVGQLAALAAHELADPLASVKSNTYVLEEQVRPSLAFLEGLTRVARARDDDATLDMVRASLESGVLHDVVRYGADTSQSLTEMKQDVERLTGMVRGLWTLSSQGRVEQRAIDVRGPLQRALQFLERQRQRKGVELRIDEPAELPLVRATPILLTQAILNVLQNALEALPVGQGGTEGLVEVRVRAENGEVRVLVSDTGVGIAPDDLTRVFKPFYTTKESDRHVGLGLSLAQEILRRHGGSLRIESDLGTGTRVTLSLPVA